jgi:hypothetical protein
MEESKASTKYISRILAEYINGKNWIKSCKKVHPYIDRRCFFYEEI